MRRSKPSARPEWANRLEGLRQNLGLSQAALAKKLNVSAMAPSRWERGVHEPPAAVFLQLGKLAGKRDCWYFWEQAGITRRDVSSALDHSQPAGQKSQPKIEVETAIKKVPKKAERLLAVPVFATSAAVGVALPAEIERQTPTDLVVAPQSWCPNPASTFCLRNGSSRMMPVLSRDTVFAVDETETRIERLLGKMVLAQHKECGLSVNWLQRFGKSDVLVPENREEEPYYLSGNPWTILGRVIWWISKAP